MYTEYDNMPYQPLSIIEFDPNSNKTLVSSKYGFKLYPEGIYRSKLCSLSFFGTSSLRDYEYTHPMDKAIILAQPALNENACLESTLIALAKSQQLSSSNFDFEWDSIDELDKYQVINLFKGKVL